MAWSACHWDALLGHLLRTGLGHARRWLQPAGEAPESRDGTWSRVGMALGNVSWVRPAMSFGRSASQNE
jgi:hypothetical protein